ncbi:meiosis-specific nuclear structural protein 1-like [Andrena cerasifolii]|uniref:meiosis-specific nuclear structural protein 1-like n=1 Tax=Andrena cerasifolii TaxID=2819439 RepID=UPI004037E795
MERKCEDEQAQQESTKITSDYIRKLRGRSRNRESYDEIAELEAELRRAYTAKELQAQLIERETERYIESIRKQDDTIRMRLDQQAAIEDDLRRKSEDLQKSEDYRRQLMEQITRKEEEGSIIKEEARREREILMEVDRIREQCEVVKMRNVGNELAESARRERLILQEMREIRRDEELEAESKKLREDEEYLKEIDQRTERVKRFHEEQLRNRELTMRKIASALLNVETRKRERETLIAELIAEDIKCELLIREEEEAIRKKTMREQLVANLKEQIVFTEQCKLRFVEQDRAFAEEIMRRIMEDEKINRLTAEARRRMQVQYREDLNRLVEKRRTIREDDILKMAKAAEEENRRRKIDLDRVQQERKCLLEEHATNVGDFLNKGALTEEERKSITQM